MDYVISVPTHELPYGDWLTMVFEAYNVSLVDKQGEEPKSYDYFEETFQSMCQLKRENGVWWLGTVIDEVEIQREEMEKEAEIQGEFGSDDKFYDAEVGVEEPADEVPAVPAFLASPADSATNKDFKLSWIELVQRMQDFKPCYSKRDDDDEAPAENVQNAEVANEGHNNQEDFDWEAVIDEVEIQREEMEKEAEIQEESRSDDKFYDAEVGVKEPADEVPAVPAFPASPADSATNVQKEKNAVGFDPSGPSGSIRDSDFLKIQAEFDRACAERLQVELDRARAKNARLQALLQQVPPQPKP
ncbi:hypothetical protein Dimus_022484 [Dionaea muscipula]